MSRVVSLWALLVVYGMANVAPALAAAPPESRASGADDRAAAPVAPPALRPLVVAGFGADTELDPRDAWMPLAVEETLAGRLRRVRGLTVVPTIRTHQARRELVDDDEALPEWSRVVPLLGARLWLTGSCSGTPDTLVLTLKLAHVGDANARPGQTQVGPGRMVAVIDDATRWALGRLGVSRLDKATEQFVFAPPSASRSALEYYAKAVSAARREDFRYAASYIGQAVASDPAFRPALMLLAKLELRAPPPRYARAVVHLRRFRELAVEAGDAVSEAEFELAQGLLEVLSRSFEAAEQRFEAALASAFERDDIYGQIAAMNHLCDLWLNRQPPSHVQLSPDVLQRFQGQSLRRAAEWQTLVLDLLARLGDVVAEAPAANKLALIYERLDEPELALQMHKRTIAAARKTGSRRTLATGWMFLGQWYRRQERWREALEATNHCLALVSEGAKPNVRIALAEIYRGMQLPREALGQYESAYGTLATGDDLVNQFRCLRAIAELRWVLGERQTAVEKLTEALDIAQVLELPDEQSLRQRLKDWKEEKP